MKPGGWKWHGGETAAALSRGEEPSVLKANFLKKICKNDNPLLKLVEKGYRAHCLKFWIISFL